MAAKSTSEDSQPLNGKLPLTQIVDAFLNSPQFGPVCRDHRTSLKRAAQMFVKFTGVDLPAANVTPSMLEAFELWCIDTSPTKNAGMYRARLAGTLERAFGAPKTTLTRKAGRQYTLRKGSKEGDLWHLYWTGYRGKNRSAEATAKQYRIQFDHFGKFLGHEPVLADLTDDILDAFLVDRSAKVSAPTANKAYWCLVSIWRHASDLGLVAKRPTVQPLPEPDQIPFAWLKEEIEVLLRTCSVVPGELGGMPARLWWLGLHWFFWSTGERKGAVLGVKKADVNLARGEVLVPAEVRKGKRKPKVYRLLPQAVEILSQMNRFERELLFPFPYSQPTLYRKYAKILKTAGLPTDRKCKFQRMRRSFGSYIEAAGGNATAALGHALRRTAERSYLDPRICGGENVAALLPELNIEQEDGEEQG